MNLKALIKNKFSTLTLSSLLLIGFPNLVNATVIQIGAMTNSNVAIDFGTFATGSTSVAAINAAAPGAGITSISFAGGSGTGTYDSDLGSGNALASDGAGGLAIVPELGVFNESTSMTIVLDHLVTQFGFQLADRIGSTLEFFNGAVSVGSILTPNILTPPVTDFFESSLAFDRIVLSQAINWVIPELVIETANQAVPVPATLTLLMAGLIGVGFSRKKSTPKS
ncbi:MAG: PEP-CTERM sorting domain-containing protein [Motiliproteus sp.]